MLRWTFRLFLLALLGVAGYFGYRTWERLQPDYYWKQAIEASEQEDYNAAFLHLQNQLRRDPDHWEAHFMMSRYLLIRAAPSATYATHPQALDHLRRAVELKPDRLDLQEKVLDAYVQTQRFHKAGQVAKRILAQQPEHATALFVLVRLAAQNNDKDSGRTWLDRLYQLDQFPVYQTLAFEHRLFGSDPDGAHGVFERLIERAKAETPDSLESLPEEERTSLRQLLLIAVAASPDAQTAHRRTAAALDLWSEIAGGDVVDTTAVAEAAGKVRRLLSSQFPVDEQAAEVAREREELYDRIDRLCSAAIESGQASARVHFQQATQAAEEQDFDRCLQHVDAALALLGGESEDKSDSDSSLLPKLHLLAARVKLLTRRWDDAEQHLDYLLQHEQFVGQAHLLSGGLATVRGQHETALAHYEHARRTLGQTVQIRMSLANTLLELGRFAEALPHIQVLRSVLDELNDEQQAWARLQSLDDQRLRFAEFRIRLALKNWPQAKDLFATLQGTALEVPATVALVKSSLSQGRTVEALERLQQARKKFPEDLDLVILQSNLWQFTGRQDEADQMVSEFAAAHPESLQAQAYHIEWQIQRGREDSAGQQLERLWEQHPNSTVLAMLKSRLLLRHGRLDEALALAEKLRGDERTEAVGSLIGAVAELNRQNVAEAADLADDALRFRPRGSSGLDQAAASAAGGPAESEAWAKLDALLEPDRFARHARSVLLQAMVQLAGREGPAAAEQRLQPLLQEHPDDALLLVLQADLLLKQNRFDEAMQVLNRVEQLRPRSPVGPYLKGDVWLKLGQGDRARMELRRAVKRAPDHLASLLRSAEAALAEQDFAPAAEWADRALAQRANHGPALLVKAEALHGMGQRAEAMRMVSDLLVSQPKLLKAYRLAASLLLEAGKADKALEICRRGRKQLPDALPLAIDEVDLLCRAGRGDEAQQLAVGLAGDDPGVAACLLLARTFYAAGEPKLALPWGRRALEVADDEQKKDVHSKLGGLALKHGTENNDRNLLAEAKEHYAALVAGDPHNLVAANNLGWILAMHFDQPQEAIEIGLTAGGHLKVQQMPQFYFDTMVKIYQAAGKPDKAMEMLQQAVSLQPRRAEWLYELGLLRMESGQLNQAHELLQRALDIGLPDDQARVAQSRIRELVSLADQN